MARNGNYVLEEPYRVANAVTLDATIAPTDAIWTNAAGDITVTMENGSDATFTLTASSGLNIAVTAVKTSGTTIDAGDLLALYR